jgi:hypothetical protein
MTTDLRGFRKDREGAYIQKDPQATLDYSVDWSDWLVGADNISTSTWTIQTYTGDAAPVVKSTDGTAGGVATIYVSGGTEGKIYRLTNRITTGSGLTDERYFRIVVKNTSA